MATNSSVFARSYNSFSGVDIKASFGNTVIAELQAVSYSITREKAPIYTMGSADPRSFSRGKRGIAGTLIFIVFDRHAVLGTIGGMAPGGGLKFLSDIDDIRPDYALGLDGTGGVPLFAGQPGNGLASFNPRSDNPTVVQNSESPIDAGTGTGDQALSAAWYVDQLPPFDVTLGAANEYGAMAVMRIFGVELLNEGYGVSIDDIVSEQQFTYVARTVIGWTPVRDEAIQSVLENQASSK